MSQASSSTDIKRVPGACQLGGGGGAYSKLRSILHLHLSCTWKGLIPVLFSSTGTALLKCFVTCFQLQNGGGNLLLLRLGTYLSLLSVYVKLAEFARSDPPRPTRCLNNCERTKKKVKLVVSRNLSRRYCKCPFFRYKQFAPLPVSRRELGEKGSPMPIIQTLHF